MAVFSNQSMMVEGGTQIDIRSSYCGLMGLVSLRENHNNFKKLISKFPLSIWGVTINGTKNNAKFITIRKTTV